MARDVLALTMFTIIRTDFTYKEFSDYRNPNNITVGVRTMELRLTLVENQ